MTSTTQFAYDSGMLSQYLAIRPSGAVICPACHGGQGHERSFRLMQGDYGLYGKCFRASCGWRYSDSRVPAERATTARPLCPYTGPIRAMPDTEIEWWAKRYGYRPRGVGITDDGRYALPIWDDTGEERGIVLRIPHVGSPLRAERDYGALPKAVTYRSAEGPCMSWYRSLAPQADRSAAVLVEDQISAMKVRYFAAVCGIALLGTDLSAEKVAEMQRTIRRVVIALDADASAKAFALARRWGQAFDSCKVLILSRDIKDLESGDWLTTLRHML